MVGAFCAGKAEKPDEQDEQQWPDDEDDEKGEHAEWFIDHFGIFVVGHRKHEIF
ncbi:hypothetical protein ZBT109_2303 [Zymobacter palmae]|uniref:Uncharacterized protein n=1 Tax=Zymobacter palmae TaxID=33074 RepID=A0A348HHD3_9GAMM|nr:hypothetical protein ZBT109_2303 [Zymobacter palmae]